MWRQSEGKILLNFWKKHGCCVASPGCGSSVPGTSPHLVTSVTPLGVGSLFSCFLCVPQAGPEGHSSQPPVPLAPPGLANERGQEVFGGWELGVEAVIPSPYRWQHCCSERRVSHRKGRAGVLTPNSPTDPSLRATCPSEKDSQHLPST